MQIKAVLENAQHPEYGQATVPLPIPKEEYDHVIELLAPLEIGSPVERDCKVEELIGAYPVFCCLEGQQVNVDELDYLMKLADSFFGGEDAQYRDTTGFRHETLTDDPQVRKAVDDILMDFAGEENPKRTCSYGLTEAGRQAMRDVADPGLPHTYAWFVMTDCGAPEEQIRRDLTLEEAIQTYLENDRPEKRIGVTKDGVATVDLVRSLDGEQQFFGDYQRLDSFKSDPEIAAAVETIQRELEQNTPQQGLVMGGPL